MAHSVSIVTPSFNQGRFLRRTIESVLTQDCPQIEYFIADGGSADETRSILESYGSRIRWVSEKDRGQAHAVNKGFQQTHGQVIGWLNSDDVYYPGAIAAACTYFAGHPEMDVLYGEANHIDELDGVIERYPTEGWSFERLLEQCYICQPAVFLRRTTLERFGVLNEDLQYCLDYEFWIRLAQSGARFGWLQRVLSGSRLYAETKTLGSRVKVHAEINSMFRERLGSVPDRWLFHYAHAVLDARGVARDHAAFPILVSLVSLAAAVRWNHWIPASVRRTTGQWLAAGFHGMWRKVIRA